jgi:hypothetical protein
VLEVRRIGADERERVGSALFEQPRHECGRRRLAVGAAMATPLRSRIRLRRRPFSTGRPR